MSGTGVGFEVGALVSCLAGAATLVGVSSITFSAGAVEVVVHVVGCFVGCLWLGVMGGGVASRTEPRWLLVLRCRRRDGLLWWCVVGVLVGLDVGRRCLLRWWLRLFCFV